MVKTMSLCKKCNQGFVCINHKFEKKREINKQQQQEKKGKLIQMRFDQVGKYFDDV